MRTILLVVAILPFLLYANDRIYESHPDYEQGDWVTFSSTRFVRHISIGEPYVYFATTGGITWLHNMSMEWQEPWTVSNGLASNDIFLVAKDMNTGYLWAVSREAISYLEPASQRWYNQYFDEMGMDGQGVSSIGFSFEGKVYLQMSDKRFYSSDNTLIHFRREGATVSSTNVTWYGRLEKRESELPFLFLPNGYEMNTEERYIHDFQLRRYPISYFVIDDWKNIWLGTWGLGIAHGSLNSMQMELLPFGLWSTAVDAIGDDGEAFWVGGLQDSNDPAGVTAWYNLDTEPEYFEPYMITGFDSDVIHAIEYDFDQDVMWFGTNMGITKFDRNNDSWRTYAQDDHLINDKVNDIVIDENSIWIATQGGVSEIERRSVGTDTMKIHHVALRALNLVPVYDLAKQYNLLWMATQYGIYVYDTEADSGGFYKGIDGPFDQRIYALDVWEDEVWFGTEIGIYAFNSYTKEWLDPPAKLYQTDARIHRMIAAEGTVWAATDDGVFKFDKQSSYWKHYTTEHGLSSNNVYSLFLERDYIWFGTDRGLTRFYWNSPYRID